MSTTNQNRAAEHSAEQLAPAYGIITARPDEHAAVYALLEQPRSLTNSQLSDGQNYTLGAIPALDGSRHILILARTATQGTNAAAIETINLLKSFPTIKIVLKVGIAGGVPNPNKPDDHVRLGDVVASDEYGILQYDFKRQTATSSINISFPRSVSHELLRAVQRLEMAEIEKHERPWMRYLNQAMCLRRATRPDTTTDVLFNSTKNKKRRLQHPTDSRRRDGEPRIFLGRIASANTLLKDPHLRDELGKMKVKAVEMESAGVADAVWQTRAGFFAVCGISDYCDDSKNDTWNPYAVIAAAAYMRALLETIEGDIPAEPALKQALRDLSASNAAARIKAARRLYAVGYRAAIPRMAHQLDQEYDPEARYWLILALGSAGGVEAKQALTKFVEKAGHNSLLIQSAIDEALKLADQQIEPF